MDASSPVGAQEERSTPSTRRALLQLAGCASLFVAFVLFGNLAHWIDERCESPDAPNWAAWQIARGLIRVAIGALLLRTAARKSRDWGHVVIWWLACLGVILILHGAASCARPYAWSRIGALGIEDLGVAPRASFAEVRDRAIAAGWALDPEDLSRMRFGFGAKHESSRRFLHVRFRLREQFDFGFDEEYRLFEVRRFRISSPHHWAGGGFTTWRAVDGVWELEGHSGGSIELDDPEERR